MKLKWFKDKFRSFSLSHSYDSRSSILSFNNNLEYNNEDPYADTDIVGNYFNKTLFTNSCRKALKYLAKKYNESLPRVRNQYLNMN